MNIQTKQTRRIKVRLQPLAASSFPISDSEMCSKREEKNIRNISFLQKMLERKADLFEQFGASKHTRKAVWQELRDYAVSIGMVTDIRDASYVRDTTWQNLRGRTLAKLEKQTGAEGELERKLDQTDHLVLEILCGLGLRDPLANHKSSFDTQTPLLDETSIDLSPSQSCATSLFQKETKKRKVVALNDNDEQTEYLKRRKLELEIRRLELEVWEKENILGVEHSQLTRECVHPKIVQYFTANEEGSPIDNKDD